MVLNINLSKLNNIYFNITDKMIVLGSVSGIFYGFYIGYKTTKNYNILSNISGSIYGSLVGCLLGSGLGGLWIISFPVVVLRALDRGIDKNFFDQNISS